MSDAREVRKSAVEEAVSEIDYTIGDNVNTLRRRARLTNAALGRHFSISASAMSLKLSGKRAWSSVDTQLAARLFGVRMAQLQGEEPMPEPTTPAVVAEIVPIKEVGPGRIELPTPTVEAPQFTPPGERPLAPVTPIHSLPRGTTSDRVDTPRMGVLTAIR